jgi:hypothetical protein
MSARTLTNLAYLPLSCFHEQPPTAVVVEPLEQPLTPPPHQIKPRGILLHNDERMPQQNPDHPGDLLLSACTSWPDLRGAGSMPTFFKIVYTVDGAILRARPASSPAILREPHPGLSAAICNTSSRIVGRVGGRPGRVRL